MYNSLPLFSEQQIKRQADKQEEFLRLVHPFLNESEKFNNECIEIRPIIRDYSNVKFVKSLNLHKFDDYGRSSHFEFLKSINGLPICIYWSGFAYDKEKDTYKEDGTEYKKGKINNQNSLYTTTLPMDFDNISMLEHEQYIDILKELGIEVITVFTGHGFQDYILLDEKCYDKEIYKKITYLLISRGFPVDESLIDPARVLRLPHTFNCKSFDSKNKYYDTEPEPIPSKRANTTRMRYNVSDILSRIESLSIHDSEYNEKYNNLNKINTIDTNNILDNKKNNDKDISFSDKNIVEFVSIQDQYRLVNFKNLPEGIKNMLTETPINFRNSVMMFLVPFLRNTVGLSLVSIIEVMKIWGSRCKPKLAADFVESEVRRLYQYNNKGVTGKYTSELAKFFGFIDFSEYNRYELDNKVVVPNDFIESYNVICDTAVRIYLMMKLFEKTDEIYEWNEEQLIKRCKVSRTTLYRNIDDLIKHGFVDKKRSNKKLGGSYLYYINKFNDKSLGFTMFNTSSLRMMVYDTERKLNNAEIKTYTYISKMISNNPTETCWASQLTLAEYLGKDRTSLTRITNDLSKKKYIKKDKYKGNDGYEHCIYTLMY